jgi:FKBP-type peptidyl-prolyl cis-trans isomerase
MSLTPVRLPKLQESSTIAPMSRSFQLPSLLVASLVLAACQSKSASSEKSSGPAATAEGAAAEAAAAGPSAKRAAEGQPAAAAAEVVPEATPPKDAVKTKSGVAMIVLKPGTGEKKPKATDTVRVNLAGYSNGQKMFSTPEPQVMPVAEMAPGWQEGVTAMVEGEKRRLWLPANVAYGNTPGARPPKEDLILELELVAIPEPPPVPKDLMAPPKDAIETESGLIYKALTKGKGEVHPTPTTRVTVHYSGWTKDGKMFDSSVMRGQPTTFPLNGVIKGWTEGVQKMVVGDKFRFWIPGHLAYGNNPRPGAPSGELVFDVELLSMQ